MFIKTSNYRYWQSNLYKNNNNKKDRCSFLFVFAKIVQEKHPES